MFFTQLSKMSIALLVLVVLFGLFFLIYRLRKFREVQSRGMVRVSEMSPDELKKLYGENLPEGFVSIDKMSREELRAIAEKELEKQGLKPGDKDFFKGPLDWDDIDENFRPRPKVIRSEFSKKVESTDGKPKDSDESEPPDELINLNSEDETEK